MNKFDVIVVGAGPAGQTTAIKTAQLGYTVALIDKTDEPKHKICGDGLTADVIKQLAYISDTLKSDYYSSTPKMKLTSYKMVGPNQHFFHLYLHGKDSFTTTRLELDKVLDKEVKRYANITCIKERVQDVEITSDKVLVTTNQSSYQSEIIIGAGGVNCKIKKKYFEEQKGVTAIAARGYYRNLAIANDELYILFDKSILPGYFWIFPLPDNTYNVGLGMDQIQAKKNKVNIGKTFQKLISENEYLQHVFAQAEEISSLQAHPIPCGTSKNRISMQRCMLVGDAAQLADAFSGEGVGNALRSGRKAAEQIARCFQENRFDAGFLKTYDKILYKMILKELKISYGFSKVLHNRQITNLFFYLFSKSTKLQKYAQEAMADVSKKRVLSFFLKLLSR